MSYNPKWVKGTEVVKRDGSNALTDDWDIGDTRRIILDELRIRDDTGLLVTDTTGNLVADFNEDLIVLGTSTTGLTINQSLAGNSFIVEVDDVSVLQATSYSAIMGVPGDTNITLNANNGRVTLTSNATNVFDSLGDNLTLGDSTDTYLKLDKSAHTVNVYGETTSGLTIHDDYQIFGINGDTYLRANPSSNNLTLYTNGNKALQVAVGAMWFFDNAGTNYGDIHHDGNNVFFTNITDDGIMTLGGRSGGQAREFLVGDPNV